MDPEQVKELIELISKSDFETFELERGDFKLKLVKPTAAARGGAVPAPAPAPAAGAPAPLSPRPRPPPRPPLRRPPASRNRRPPPRSTRRWSR